jgi:uncharacterized membrane protein YhaH (DUF805 family)
MDFQYLYLRTDGRISRKTWWISAIILGVTFAILSLLILPLVGLGMPNAEQLAASVTDATQIGPALLSAMQASAWGSLILYLLSAYPFYCLSIKRRHDRNNAGIDVIVYLAGSIVISLVQALGLAFTVGEVAGMVIPVPSLLFSVLGGALGIFGIYMIVVLGFLKGTAGPNTYGPDPLEA